MSADGNEAQHTNKQTNKNSHTEGAEAGWPVSLLLSLFIDTLPLNQLSSSRTAPDPLYADPRTHTFDTIVLHYAVPLSEGTPTASFSTIDLSFLTPYDLLQYTRTTTFWV
jgi:hypothetical protein